MFSSYGESRYVLIGKRHNEAVLGSVRGWSMPTVSGRSLTRFAMPLILVAAAVTIAGRNGALVDVLGAKSASVTARPTWQSSATPPSTSRSARSQTATTTARFLAPVVAPMAALREADVLVTLPESTNPAAVRAIRALKEVQAVEVVDTGTVQLQGGPAVTIGVDPGTFRNFTPSITAGSDQLWQYVAKGALAASFDMARDRKLTLGADVAIVAADGLPLVTPQRLGAFMSVGLPGIDLVVSRAMRGSLKLRSGAGLILSAPATDPLVLQTEIKTLAPGASVVLTRPGVMLGRAGGSFVSRAQTSTVLAAAISRVGKPYVWGATGPDTFDCSGLMGWSFAVAGISLPRTAAEQALSGPRVPLNLIQPGDLLFWSYDPANPTFIDHVAMYLGNGNMVDAPQTGQLVQVVKMATGHMVGAVRVNPAISGRLGGPWIK
jgi:hypothetical protein